MRSLQTNIWTMEPGFLDSFLPTSNYNLVKNSLETGEQTFEIG
jgi:hypothetical protein